MTLIPIQTLGPQPPDGLSNEAYLPAAGKRQLRQAWQHFIAGGFKKLFFTRELYRFLHGQCGFMAHTNQDTFWAYYFNSDVARLRAFLNQFGGSGHAAESGAHTWLEGPAADLKGTMVQDMARLYAPLLQVLEDLEIKHAELGRAWRDFALAGGVPDPGYPPHYTVSENTRNLLAYAAYIALHKPPLRALQQQFPLPAPPEALGLAARAA